MSLKSIIVPAVTANITGVKRLNARRAAAEKARKAAHAPHVVEYFHQVDDPYSHLTAQALVQLAARYDVEVRPYLVNPPEDWAAPERERLKAYARLDSARLADRSGLTFRHSGLQPSDEDIRRARGLLAAEVTSDGFLHKAVALGEALWSGAAVSSPTPELEAAGEVAAAEGDARRKTLGHFMSAMTCYGGEWYWSIDRLHYLEERLAELKLRRPDASAPPIFAEPPVPFATGRVSDPERQVLRYYLSFRSPYTYIAAERAKALADAYGLELRLRFVLPMVMRGLPVPPMKSMYFTLDTAREARRVGVPFGRICDPVGKPVERGYSLLPWAISEGKGYDFCLAFMRGVWANGVDAGGDSGMKQIVRAAGLDWDTARKLLGNDDWRAEAERNRQELLDLGHWGVPCFRVGDVIVWGQDRLWVIEDALRR